MNNKQNLFNFSHSPFTILHISTIILDLVSFLVITLYIYSLILIYSLPISRTDFFIAGL